MNFHSAESAHLFVLIHPALFDLSSDIYFQCFATHQHHISLWSRGSFWTEWKTLWLMASYGNIKQGIKNRSGSRKEEADVMPH